MARSARRRCAAVERALAGIELSPRTFTRVVATLAGCRAAPVARGRKTNDVRAVGPKRVAQADGPHVVLVVDGRAGDHGARLSSSGHPRITGLSHRSIDKVYPDDDIMDLPPCFLIAQMDLRSQTLGQCTAYEYSGGLTFEHGGIELVAVYSDGLVPTHQRGG